ncbi:MAG: hypothetical protein MR481_07770, partial [Campylobacter sp.]|uniref:beta strand repeat-containing protein n=1 Tax=Campylobacter sp. TaxID=205 RepID=UPI002AA7D509
TGKNSTAKIYKIEVGKDLKVGKLDQMATVNVADKAQLSAQDFGAGTPAPSETVDTKDLPVTGGELDLSTVVMSENKAYVVELSTNPNVASIASVKLPAGINATELTIVDSSTTAKPTGPVAVSVPADATITTLKLGSTADTTTQYNVKVEAGAKINEIVTNNANNNIDISAVAPENAPTIIDAGQGIDTLVIANNAAANLTTMKNIENLQYSGTKLNADAIMTNAESGITELTVENTSGENGKALEIVAGANTQIDLSSLVQKAGATNKAALDITGFKTSTGSTQAQSVKLTNTTAESSFAETVKLGDATGITVTNIGTGDKLSAKTFGSEVNGAFSNYSSSLTANQAFYTTAADAAAAEEAAANAAKTLASGQAILAVNVGNEARIYAVTGAAESKGTYSLVAIVDNNIDGEDTVTKAGTTDTTITFTAPGVTTNVFDYDSNVKTLDLADGKYGQGTKAPTFTSPIAKGDSIAINNVKGDITITDSGAGEKASQGTVKLFALDGTTLNASSNYNKIDVYLGGYYDETAGKIVADDTITLAASNNFDTKAANVYYNAKELKGAFANFTKAVDLKGTGSDDIAAKVTITDATGIAVANNVDIDAKFANATANDTITYTLATSTASNAVTVKTTTAADNITLSKVDDSKPVILDMRGTADTAKDTINAVANVLKTEDTLSGIYTVKDAGTGDKIKFVNAELANANGLVAVTADNSGNDLKAAIITALKNGGASAAANTLYLVTVEKSTTTTTDNGSYLVYSKSADNKLSANDDIVIKLAGNTNVTLSADKLGVDFGTIA